MKVSVPWSEVTSLEEKVKAWFLNRQAVINKASSELQISASPPLYVSGRRKKKKSSNLELKRLEEGEYVLEMGRKKLPYHIVFALACQSWFYPKDLATATRFLILEERKRWNLCHEELDLVLSNKGQCILYLQEKVHLRGWDWLFGSIITDKFSCRIKSGKNVTYQLEELFPRYRYRLKKKPQPVTRRRGYRDHGSLGDLSVKARREEQSRDFTCLQEEEIYEQRKRNHEGLIGLLKGWFS